MPTASLLASSASATTSLLCKALSGTRQGPSLRWEGSKKASLLGGEGSVLKKDLLPAREEKAYERRLLPLPGGRSVQEKARDISRESKLRGTCHAYSAGRSPVSSRERS
jgi:hypothetical protein